MPKAPRRCPHRDCPNLITHTKYCDDHTEPWMVSTGWARPAGWDGIRQTVLDRDAYRCHVCGRQGADTVDHLTPLSQGGSNDLSNLAAIHDRNPPHCHRAKTNQDRAPGTSRHT